MVRREPRRLGIAGVDDPDLGVLREVADRAAGIRQADGMPVGDNGIAADEHRERGVVVVGATGQRRRAAHQLGHQDLCGAVDRQRTELRRRAYRGVQRLRDAIADRIHSDSGTELMPTDSGPCVLMVSRSFVPRSSRQASHVVFCSVPSIRICGRSRRSGWWWSCGSARPFGQV